MGLQIDNSITTANLKRTFYLTTSQLDIQNLHVMYNLFIYNQHICINKAECEA